jgi:hypothetical protein
VFSQSGTSSDGESTAFDAALYGHSAAINSQLFRSLQSLSGSPILLLDSISRIAFVLHRVLGYKISDAATKARVSEKQYRAQLRRAYRELASFGLQDVAPRSGRMEQSAPAWGRTYELVEMDSCLLV